MTDDKELSAAVARLRDDAYAPAVRPEFNHVVLVRTADVRAVLAALEAAQADASDAFLRGYNRGLRHAEERAVDAAMKGEV